VPIAALSLISAQRIINLYDVMGVRRYNIFRFDVLQKALVSQQ